MTEDDVRAELGQVKQQNVRQPGGGAGGLALSPRGRRRRRGVLPRPGRTGSLEVDDTNFEAVPSPTGRPAGGEAGTESAAD